MLARLSLALGAFSLPAMIVAQEVDPQSVLDDDAAPVTQSAAGQNMTSPPMARYAMVQPWTVDNAQGLLSAVRGIGAEGLDPADYRPAALEQAIAFGEGEQLDRLASEIFTWLVEDLRDGRTPMEARKQWFVVDPDPDLHPTGEVMGEALASGDISGTLMALNPIYPDYAVLKAKLAETPESDTAKRKLIRINMDRWRWLARDLGGQYLITNVPEYQLRLTVNNKIIQTYRTVVGKPGRTATPQLAEMVEGVVFNPTWTVPQSIVKGEGLGAKVLNNPTWAKRNGYKATKGANGWVTVVQQPGPGNSLGLMKLDMPNRHAIFLHDTPSRHLFKNDNRALSHGCIRVESALRVAMMVAMLGNGDTREDFAALGKEYTAISTSGKYTKVPVKKQMPVYITYFTYGVDIDGDLHTFRDIYGRDAPVLAALDAPRKGNRGRETDEEVIVIEDDLQDS
ncbi:L,D-transpeptidase family protein [Paraurantiacibacter namhicola]|uniref:Murein L,D-transpeptidase n=1 Tax=Paraurantiacibacter namhicola TaxID=645517 RepID=A0A1C7DBX2_9SPHN|nr:L,D-transpeptidase family protein [Paraurantiacibacter namhicola]ANU08811.1 murein L,D-transpeptidase [Paraurantiacibacter namhicola]